MGHHESNNSLILRDLAFSDSGIYTCVGGTSIRDLDTMSGVLTVVGVAPSLAMADVETEWWEGDRIEVECLLEKGLTEQGRPSTTRTMQLDRTPARVPSEQAQSLCCLTTPYSSATPPRRTLASTPAWCLPVSSKPSPV